MISLLLFHPIEPAHLRDVKFQVAAPHLFLEQEDELVTLPSFLHPTGVGISPCDIAMYCE